MFMYSINWEIQYKFLQIFCYWLKTWIFIWRYTNLYGILRNFALLHCQDFCGIMLNYVKYSQFCIKFSIIWNSKKALSKNILTDTRQPIVNYYLCHNTWSGMTCERVKQGCEPSLCYNKQPATVAPTILLTGLRLGTSWSMGLTRYYVCIPIAYPPWKPVVTT